MATPRVGPWGGGREGGSQPLQSRSPCLPAVPNNVHSKYRPVSLKRRFRTCRPDAATEPVAVNIWGLAASFRSFGGVCLPQNAAGAEPAGYLVGKREQGAWETGKKGKLRTLPVSRGAGEGPVGSALHAVLGKCFAHRWHRASGQLGLVHTVSCALLICKWNTLAERSRWEIRLLEFAFYLCAYQLCGPEQVP